MSQSLRVIHATPTEVERHRNTARATIANSLSRIGELVQTVEGGSLEIAAELVILASRPCEMEMRDRFKGGRTPTLPSVISGELAATGTILARPRVAQLLSAGEILKALRGCVTAVTQPTAEWQLRGLTGLMPRDAAQLWIDGNGDTKAIRALLRERFPKSSAGRMVPLTVGKRRILAEVERFGKQQVLVWIREMQEAKP